MAPMIWGLDLGEMQWSKFKREYMFKNRDYHLRRTKFIVYQLAMIFCVASESLSTAVLSDRVDQQILVERLDDRVLVHNNNYVGVASYNIFSGIFVSFIFGTAFFFDLFWPERHEDRGVRVAWKACAVMACVFGLSSALALTIVAATQNGYVRDVSIERARELLAHFTKNGGAPLQYKHNVRAIAAVVFIWLGFCFTFASAVIMLNSIDHNEKLGPRSEHARNAEKLQRDVEAQHKDDSNADGDKPPTVQSGQDAEAQLQQTHGTPDYESSTPQPAELSHGAVYGARAANSEQSSAQHAE